MFAFLSELEIPWQVALYPLLPVAAIAACLRYAALRKAGVVLLCYGAGILLGNVGYFPDDAGKVQEGMANAAVAFALPLLLFSMDVRRWFSLAGKAVLSMAAACLAAVAVSMLGSFLTAACMADSWKVAGMAVGVYTGGTPNVAAIRSALGVDTGTFVIFHTYDTVVSVVYIIFCMTAARRVFRWLLPPFESAGTAAGAGQDRETQTESLRDFVELLRPARWPSLAAMSLLSCAAVSIVVITTLSIGASFVPAVRRAALTFPWGMYVVYVFCCIVGSMVDARILTHVHYPVLFIVTTVIFGGMALHALLCRLLRVDVDTFIITSVSAICSPPFVPPVAEALNNRRILLSGITTGIIGYALGNYLGIATAYLMRRLLA
jgi:uncharacterized membrane protein